jgi:septum formation protein
VIYLASTSPRRRALLKRAGVVFRVLQPSYHENNCLNGKPSKIVQVHAEKKAESCIKQIQDGTILAADTVVYLKGEIIGKPKNMARARSTLKKLQGKWHLVYTGVAIFKIVSGRIAEKTVFFEKTSVRLQRLTLKGIMNYLDKVNPLDKAGAYAIQSPHSGIVCEVKGLFSNAVGLPIEKILLML